MADTLISPKITHDPWFQFFSGCIGAIDGTHIRAFVPIEEHPTMHNRKGYLSQNCLFVCDFDLLFTYAMTGWDGASADATSEWSSNASEKIPSCGCWIWWVRHTSCSIQRCSISLERMASGKLVVSSCSVSRKKTYILTIGHATRKNCSTSIMLDFAMWLSKHLAW